MKRLPLIAFLLGMILHMNSQGQISQGGMPLTFNQLKSAYRVPVPIIEMPEFSMKLLKSQDIKDAKQLKPFQFAHPFQVDISSDTDGVWTTMGNYRVWQVAIHSEGAYSLNLIFDQYKLPEGAKLYLYNDTHTKVIGAFTSANNKPSGSLATAPVPGDIIYAEYSEPLNAEFKGILKIGKVNHDYKNTFGKTHRRLEESDECNWPLNINCELGAEWHKEKRAVARLIVDGSELCTGTLLNNVQEDNTPYLLTANHCIENDKQAENTLFYFNYESPNCVQLDGIAEHQISGSDSISGSIDLDFSLVKLSVKPPAEYQPYLAGWNNEAAPPTGSVCIHHPNGDIKKITNDDNLSFIDSYSGSYLQDGFIRVARWENGTTEGGSSGGPLFNSSGQVVGTLTGGSATCSNPVNDYFSRFHSQWDHYFQENKSLRYHLDTIPYATKNIPGKEMYSGRNRVYALSNFSREEVIKSQSVSQEYLAGHNSKHAVEFAEEFEGYGSSLQEIHGVSLGFSRLKHRYSNSRIKLKIYEGVNEPDDENPIYEEFINLINYDENAMNYISFSNTNPILVSGKFFVGYEISYTTPSSDTVAVYVAEKRENRKNSSWVKVDNKWLPFSSNDYYDYPTSLFLEVYVSGLEDTTSTPPPYKQDDFNLYPNPVKSGNDITLALPDFLTGDISIELYDIQGNKKDNLPIRIYDPQEFTISVGNLPTGIYLLSIKSDTYWKTKKLTILNQE